MVITERLTVSAEAGRTFQADTTFWLERPPEPEVAPTTRFYTLAEAAISFLEGELGEPARLRDYVLALLTDRQDPPDPMAELGRRLGMSGEEIESRWSEWVRAATMDSG